MLDVKLLEKAIAEKDHVKLSQLIKEYNLKIVDGKITCDKATLTKYQEYWDKKQLVTKISLNSVYGILLQVNCRFFDKRFGQSITLTGRQIVKHMCSKVNDLIAGEYNYVGASVTYGDSITGDSNISISDGSEETIEQLFNRIKLKTYTDNGKEYAIPIDEIDSNGDLISVLGYDSYNDVAQYGAMAFIVRHKTRKKKWKIIDEDGKEVIVTDDHSIIVDRDGFILEVKPSELRDADLLISI